MKTCTKIPFVGVRANVVCVWRDVAIGLLVVTFGLAAVSAPRHVAATPIYTYSALRGTNATVYLFDTDNTPVPAPEASIIEGEVYTDTGTHFLGTIDTDYNIRDANNNIVGYITYPIPG